MRDIGYAWIQNAVGAPDFLGKHRARLAPVNRIERLDDGAMLVPQAQAFAESVGRGHAGAGPELGLPERNRRLVCHRGRGPYRRQGLDTHMRQEVEFLGARCPTTGASDMPSGCKTMC